MAQNLSDLHGRTFETNFDTFSPPKKQKLDSLNPPEDLLSIESKESVLQNASNSFIREKMFSDSDPLYYNTTEGIDAYGTSQFLESVQKEVRELKEKKILQQERAKNVLETSSFQRPSTHNPSEINRSFESFKDEGPMKLSPKSAKLYTN